jgi:DNA-binding NtrC family response regulator
MIAEGKFREDLYYRLNVIKIHLPPLRERAGDILLLAERFIETYAKKVGKAVKGLDSEAAATLTAYDWPGNVRELENIIERGIVLTNSEYLTASDLAGLNTKSSVAPVQSVRPLSEVEKEHIRFCLGQFDWSIAQTAEKLGIHRNTLRAKIKEYKLSPE